MQKKILVIEDKQSLADMLKKVFSEEGFNVITSSSLNDANNLLKTQKDISLILSDLKLPDGDGITVLHTAKETMPQVPVILMTAYGTIDIAVKAVKDGAYDFITKPFDIEHLITLVNQAISESQGTKTISHETEYYEIIGVSQKWKEVIKMAQKVSNLTTTVLILGESGTGKEVIAHYIHKISNRARYPFVAVNCSAIPKELVENELFGHEKGAFTGAAEMKRGRFELADKGTIFLDEIGEMSNETQAKLLRVIQDNTFIRVGGSRQITVDARLIAASNKDLKKEVEKGNFRSDLFYRLNVFPIYIPPLRERREDIKPLIEYYLSFFSEKFGKKGLSISDDAINLLMTMPWYGNVRELKNTIERAVILCENDTIDIEYINVTKTETQNGKEFPSLQMISQSAQRMAEKEMITEVLNQTNWNKTRASEILKISYKTLLNKIKEYNLEQPIQ
ncbi:MAG: sigma-54 dependent transcriptional regulator [Thermodesulfovibrionales bacterium]|nr:sigma-54 dependent transcriptional regulator [Thermodesulfovibrionales bacterium]